jgi:hypothetical protein
MNNCPKCNTRWIGDKIPDDIAEHVSFTHWRREIGIDGGYMGIYDGLVAIRCPDCSEEFPVSKHKVHLEMFDKYMKLKGEQK